MNRLVTLLIFALVGTGCASRGGQTSRDGAAESTGAGVTIIVENTASPGTSLSVQLVSSSGDRVLLGAVGPRRTETFEADLASWAVSYRLVAGLTGGGEIVSESFTLSPGASLRWILPFNTLRTSS